MATCSRAALPASFAKTGHRYVCGRCAAFECRQRIGSRHAQIIMCVECEFKLRYRLFQFFNQFADFERIHNADCIGNPEAVGTQFVNPFAKADQQGAFGPGRILCAETDT